MPRRPSPRVAAHALVGPTRPAGQAAVAAARRTEGERREGREVRHRCSTPGARACAFVACLIGCGARVTPAPAPDAAADDDLVLYRDRALVRHRLEIVAPASGQVTVPLQVAAGVRPADLIILDRDELVVTRLRVPRGTDAPAPPRSIEPTALELVVGAPRAGRFALSLGYATDRITWQAAYTLTANAARDRAVLRGAVAIRNTTGLALRARIHLIDAALGAWRDPTAGHLDAALLGTGADPALPARACDLGVLALGDGETRAALLSADPPRRLRSVLVYDPIGTRLDHAAAMPALDPALGAGAASSRVAESFEIERGDPIPRGLPAGPVRLLERRADSSLAVLGESPLFGPATRVAAVDTIAVGTADGVTGHRERRDFTKDLDQRRFSEDVLITIDNARPRPIEVVVREHLYRGLSGTVAYHSSPSSMVKEGPQQIALRTTVPANGQVKVLYVVVYTW